MTYETLKNFRCAVELNLTIETNGSRFYSYALQLCYLNFNKTMGTETQQPNIVSRKKKNLSFTNNESLEICFL